MTPPSPRPTAQSLFEILIADESSNRSSLDSVCSTYPHLAEELSKLWDANELLDQMLGGQSGAGEESGGALDPPVEKRVLGDFELQRFLARGGMGEVWEAKQLSLDRTVALKLILPERLSQQGLALFAREARAGGRLHHPGITAVYGTGKDSGMNWIALEFIRGGRDLRALVDREREGSEATSLSFYRSTGALFLELTEALEHAHQAGVIHRDLKPRNVLIAPDGSPKITDFGLARITDEAALSQTGDFVGTYSYMSPEQVTGRRIGIDHRTDIFSLGVMLYEVLCAHRPFEGDSGQQIALKIVTQDPPPLEEFRSRVPRDLSVICGKCLEKAPQRRYQTAADLARDLRSYLEDRPIAARPPSRLERMAKWIRRNPTRSSVAAVCVVAVLVISILLVDNIKRSGELEQANAGLRSRSAELSDSNALLAQKTSDLKRANTGLTERESDLVAINVLLKKERVRADEEAGAARQVSDFMTRIFESADPGNAGRFDMTALEVLEIAAEEISTSFGDTPRIRGALLGHIGSSLAGLHQSDLALPMLRESAEIAHREVGELDSFTVWVDSKICLTEFRGGEVQGSIDEMYDIIERGEKVWGAGSDEVVTLLVDLAHMLVEATQYEEAEAVALDAVEVGQLKSGGIPSVAIRALTALGRSIQKQGRFEEALEILESAHQRGVNEGTLGTSRGLVLMNNLGGLYMMLGRLAEARKLLEDGLERTEEIYGPMHSQTAISLDNLGSCLMGLGEYRAAEPIFRRSVESFIEVYGPDEVDTLIAEANLANCLGFLGGLDESCKILEGILSRLDPTTREKQLLRSQLCSVQVDLLLRAGNSAEAIAPAREAIEIQRQLLPEGHYQILASECLLGICLIEAGEYEEGLSVLQAPIPALDEALGIVGSMSISARLRLVDAHRALGNTEQATSEAASLREVVPEGTPMRATVDTWLNRAGE